MLQLTVALTLSLSLLVASCKSRSTDSQVLNSSETSEFTIETNNNAALRAKMKIIDDAKTSLDIAYYIFKDDVVGKSVALKIVDAANRGVKVRLIVDGSMFLNRDFFKAMVATNPDNISIAYFRPITFDGIAKEFQPTLNQLAGMVGKLFTGSNDGVSNLSYHELLASSPTQLKTLWDLGVGSFLNPMKVLPSLSDMNRYNGMSFAQSLANTLSSTSSKKMTMNEISNFANYLASRTKRMHHKLILADNSVVVTGGRNMWAPSHFDHDQLQNELPGDIATVDTDIFARSAAISRAAKANFDTYWDCIDNPKCPAGIDMERETPSKDGVWYWGKNVQGSAINLEANLKANRWGFALGNYTYKGKATNVSFIANSMHKDPSKNGFLSEVPNQISLAFADRLNAAKAGDKILLKSAYMILPPEIYEPMLGAVMRGADVTLFTNSVNAADHRIVPFFGRQQYAPFINAVAQGKGKLQIYQYNYPQLIHDKVLIAGDYIYVGSSNLDPRSIFLNTEIGFMIGPDNSQTGISFATSYYDWQMQQISTLLGKKLKDKTGAETAMVEKVELSDLLKEEFEPSYYSFVERPSYEAFMSLREAFKKSILDNPNKIAYQDYLYRYLLLQL